MNNPRHRWEDPYDEPRKPSRLDNWHRLPMWAFWILIVLALLAFVLIASAMAASTTAIR